MQNLKTISRLLRGDQWFKNLVIFAPLLFASNQNIYPIDKLIIGFLGFCSVSSITYIINDWLDRKKDRLHPIKKNRPLASGKITGRQAIIVVIILALMATSVSLLLGLYYGLIVSTYFIFTNLYSLGLKNIPLVDILMVSGNFILRMASGLNSIPNINTLPYFGILFGLLIVFLTHKRRSDIKLLGEKAIAHKPVLKFYTIRNNYFFRGIGYLIAIVSFYKFYESGFSIYKSIGLFFMLAVTSIIFSDNPEYTSKPQWLFRSKLWVSVLIINILLFVFL
ncbi:UbiA family prenyltransferase [Candidatus Peregrinibacteria bacterium]|nr:UbiA family prenyltransferase [Candidatus Peregrinibacteria bacterium]